jgi:hypothetical protein
VNPVWIQYVSQDRSPSGALGANDGVRRLSDLGRRLVVLRGGIHSAARLYGLAAFGGWIELGERPARSGSGRNALAPLRWQGPRCHTPPAEGESKRAEREAASLTAVLSSNRQQLLVISRSTRFDGSRGLPTLQ